MTQALPPGCRPIRNTDEACAVIPGYCARADGIVFRQRPRGDWVPLGAFFHNQISMVIRIRLPDGRYRDLALGRVICRAFHGPRPLGHDVFYWPDDDRRNCRADNLRWAPRGTSKLGTLIRRRHNTPPGEGNPQAVLVERTVRWMRREYRRGRTSQSIAR